MARGFRAQRFDVIRIDVMTFDHAVESLAIDREEARRGLLVAASMFEYARDVTAFDLGQGDPIVICRTRFAQRR